MTDHCGWFVTGTDTGVGKTVVTLGLMQCLQDQGYTVAGMKPVAAGCEWTPHGLRNADAVLLQRQASRRFDYALVNPVALAPPIAPHIAAQQAGVPIHIEEIRRTFEQIGGSVDCIVVEGVGGWRVPLNDRDTLAELAKALALEVVLVVGIRLGCLNHALLTAESIAASGLQLAGWVANCLPPASDAAEENINALKSRLSAPLLGVVPCLDALDIKIVANALRVPAPG